MELKPGTGLHCHSIYYTHSSRDTDRPQMGSMRWIKLRILTVFKPPSQSLPNTDG